MAHIDLPEAFGIAGVIDRSRAASRGGQTGREP
jgi:hypothetical protein